MTMETTWKSDEGELIRVRTCGWSPPGDHPVGCGMFIYTDKDGKFVKVEGDPDHQPGAPVPALLGDEGLHREP